MEPLAAWLGGGPARWGRFALYRRADGPAAPESLANGQNNLVLAVYWRVLVTPGRGLLELAGNPDQ